MAVLSKPFVPPSVKTNALYGAVLGIIVTAIKFAHRIRKHVHGEPPQHVHSKRKQRQKQSTLSLILSIIKYFCRFPLFVASFSWAFKLLIRQPYIKDHRHKRHIISLLIFAISFVLHRCFGIFNLSLSVYLLARALYGYMCYMLPVEYQMNSYDVAGLGHGFMSVYLGYYNGFVPPTFWKAVEQAVGERKATWYFMLGNHHHGQTPPCQSCVHVDRNEQSCLKSFVNDSPARIKRVSLFYFKYLSIPTLIKLLLNYKAGKLDKQSSMKLIQQLLLNTFGASGYWIFGLHCTSRIMCFHRWIIGKLQNECRLSGNAQPFEVVANNNYWSLVTWCCVLGWMGARCQAPQRATDVNVAALWQVGMQTMRMWCDIESDDTEQYHWLLGSNTFSSFLVAMSISLNTYLYFSKESSLKGLERSLIHSFLVNS